LIRLRHTLGEPSEAAMMGSGWEYYLDRLCTLLDGGNPDELDFERDYLQGMQEYYDNLAG
jgi:hypothetical protein